MNGAACGKGRRLFVVRIPGQLQRTKRWYPTALLRLRIAFLMVLPRDSRSGETLAEFATFSTHGRERVGAETAGPPESDARCSWTKLRAEVQWYN